MSGLESAPCHDCRASTDSEWFYWVHDEIWQAAGDVRGLLCIGCLERRLGRQLCAEDFPDGSLNDHQACTESFGFRPEADSPRLASRRRTRAIPVQPRETWLLGGERP